MAKPGQADKLGFARFAAAHYSAGNPLHPGMMAQWIDSPIAAPEKSAQEPTGETNQNRATERAPEAIDVKTMNKLVHQQEHDRVHDKDKNPKSQDNERRGQQQEDWPDKRIENSKEKRRADQGANAVVTNAANYSRSHHDRDRRDRPSKNEVSHP